MFLKQFFDVLGLPIQSTDDLWPEDLFARRQARIARLMVRLKKCQRALVRRRRLIEKLREKTAHYPRRPRHEAYVNSLQEHERLYRLQLSKFQQARGALRNLRAAIPTR
jgi:hypothetical protein